MKTNPSKPWADGPREIIDHAQGHLNRGSDLDRRIALIGFDQAIELCIDVFINLPPKLSGTSKIARDDKDRISENFNTRLTYLESYVQARKLSVPADFFETILWYHQLRNKLYHESTGLVPEIKALNGVRDNAVTVFELLFGYPPLPAAHQNQELSAKDIRATTDVVGSDDPRMDFLASYIAFTREIGNLTGEDIESSGRSSVLVLWEKTIRISGTLDRHTPQVHEAIKLRNQIVHHSSPEIDLERLAELTGVLNEIVLHINMNYTG